MLLVVSPVGIRGGGPNLTHSVYEITFPNKAVFRFNNHR